MNRSFRNRILPALAAAIVLAGAVSAQTATAPSTPPPASPPAAEPGAHWGGPLRRLGIRREIAAKLGLSSEQKAQLKAARESAKQQIHAIRDDTTLSPEDKKARVRAILASTRDQMQQVLTPEQRQQLEQLRAEHRGQGVSGPTQTQ